MFFVKVGLVSFFFFSCIASMLRTAQSEGASTQKAILNYIGKTSVKCSLP